MASPEEYQHHKRTLCSINLELLRTPLCTHENRQRKSTPSKNGMLIIHLCSMLSFQSVRCSQKLSLFHVWWVISSPATGKPLQNEWMNAMESTHKTSSSTYYLLHLCWSKRSPPVAEVDSGSSFCREECFESDGGYGTDCNKIFPVRRSPVTICAPERSVLWLPIELTIDPI